MSLSGGQELDPKESLESGAYDKKKGFHGVKFDQKIKYKMPGGLPRWGGGGGGGGGLSIFGLDLYISFNAGSINSSYSARKARN